jgi:hypothetical protein
MTKSLFTYLTYGTDNGWCSVDTQFDNGVGSASLSFLFINPPYTPFIMICVQLALRLLRIQDQKSLTRRCHSFSRCGREHVPIVFNDRCGQNIRKGAWYTNVHISQLAIGYLKVAINRKSWKQAPEIETDVSSQPQHKPQVDMYRLLFGTPKCSVSGSWVGLEPTQTVFTVRTQTVGWLPRPVSNTTYIRPQLMGSRYQIPQEYLNWRSALPKHELSTFPVEPMCAIVNTMTMRHCKTLSRWPQLR